MYGHQQKRRRLRKLWDQNPNCHWCGKKTVLPKRRVGGPASHDLATIDHINSRFKKERFDNPNNLPNTVLACYECNHRRGEEEDREYRQRMKDEILA